MKFFKSFKDWKKFILSAIQNVFVGLFRIVYAFVNGAISLIVGVFRSIGAFARREPRAMLVIIILFACILFAWMMNFVNERSMRVSAEYQRDSLSLKLDSARQSAYILESMNFNHLDGDE